ncbi:MAG: prepilin-type N-terminal cleavage/methylation domain-containing protein [Acidimicrobiia bacterium]
MSSRPEPAGESGMTLIEIMIALVILSIVVIGVLALLATLVRASDISNRKTEAETHVTTAAEYLKFVDFDYGRVDDCQAHYANGLAAFATANPSPGFTPSVTVYRANSTNITAGDEITTPAAGAPCLDDSTPGVRLSVAITSDDGAVSRTQDVVLRCDVTAAKAAGGKCL